MTYIILCMKNFNNFYSTLSLTLHTSNSLLVPQILLFLLVGPGLDFSSPTYKEEPQ